jgi:DNA-binding NtrC family response regulator
MKSVMVIDDELGYRQMLELDLNRQGYRVVTAGGGAEALSLLEKDRVDIVVTDMKMPKMSGLDTMTAIRKKFPDLPIVLMTGYAVEDMLTKAMQFKRTASLRKPFNMTDLNKAVKELLPA